VSFDVRVAGPAERYLNRLQEPVRGRVLGRLDQIAEDPYGPHTKPLQGGGGRRGARVGGLRIVFTVDRDRRVIDVSDIGPRGQIYRRL
jgi:mRNA-degrading endonuclease RelE of RelBE toxin-antitoxin system